MKKAKKLTLKILPGKFGICHLGKNIPIPDWVNGEGDLISVTRTMDELSIIFSQEKIPAGVFFEKDWRAFKLLTSGNDLDFTATGIVSALALPLAKAKISIFCVSTYETNYILVEEKNFEKAAKVLGKSYNVER